MSRRYLSLWLPEWPIERMRLKARRGGLPFPPEDGPLALVASERGVPRLAAVGRAARALGLAPGMALADARAACPELPVRQAEPAADAAELAALGLWCARYSPRVMVDGADGLAIDLTGCSHLFGGERSLLADLAELGALMVQDPEVQACPVRRISRSSTTKPGWSATAARTRLSPSTWPRSRAS